MIAMQVRHVVHKLINSVRAKPVWPARGASKIRKRPNSNNWERTRGCHAGEDSVSCRWHIGIDLLAHPVHAHKTKSGRIHPLRIRSQSPVYSYHSRPVFLDRKST